MFYTRSSYVGQTTKDGKRMHGRGIYTLADGSKYVGTFHDGTFHGHGIIFFTPANGGGQFRGTWNLGECLGGDHVFSDGLIFSNDEWEYTTDRDRRFWSEYLTFIKPVGKGGKGGADDEGTLTPDYFTTDGVPPSLADGKPRAAEDVSDDFWALAPLPRPEHEGVAPIVGTSEDMAVLIAQTRVGGPVTKAANVKGAKTAGAPTAKLSGSSGAAPVTAIVSAPAPPSAKNSRPASAVASARAASHESNHSAAAAEAPNHHAADGGATPSGAELEAFAAKDAPTATNNVISSARNSGRNSATAAEASDSAPLPSGGSNPASARDVTTYTPITAGAMAAAADVVGDVVEAAVALDVSHHNEESAEAQAEAEAGAEAEHANADDDDAQCADDSQQQQYVEGEGADDGEHYQQQQEGEGGYYEGEGEEHYPEGEGEEGYPADDSEQQQHYDDEEGGDGAYYHDDSQQHEGEEYYEDGAAEGEYPEGEGEEEEEEQQQ